MINGAPVQGSPALMHSFNEIRCEQDRVEWRRSFRSLTGKILIFVHFVDGYSTRLSQG